MLVLVRDDRSGCGFAAAAALARRLGLHAAPAAVVETRAAAERWPEHEARAEKGRGAVHIGVSAAEAAWTGGARTLIALFDETGGVTPGEWAFWLRRAADQPVLAYEHGGGAGTGQLWADRVAGEVRAGRSGLAVVPWEPEPPRIETARLVLTWPTPEQTRDHYRAIAGTAIFRTLTWDGPASEAEMHDYVLRARQGYAAVGAGVGGAGGEGGNRPLHLAVIEKVTGRQIGSLGYRPHVGATYPQGMIGYALEEPSHGRGFGTEAVGGFVGYAFERNGVERVEAEVFVGNTVSRRVLEKVGFTLQGTMLAKSLKGGRKMDEWLYALNREDWAGMPAALRPSA